MARMQKILEPRTLDQMQKQMIHNQLLNLHRSQHWIRLFGIVQLSKNKLSDKFRHQSKRLFQLRRLITFCSFILINCLVPWRIWWNNPAEFSWISFDYNFNLFKIFSRLVIPSPIARPTPKTDGMAMNNSTKKVDMWTGLDEEQRLDASKKVSALFSKEIQQNTVNSLLSWF